MSNTVEMASLDGRWSESESCGRRGEGRTSGMAIANFAWIRACVKAGLLDDPDYPEQQNGNPPKKEWKLHVEYTSGLRT